jgi:transcriptional pleiotropic regulator of transition state genes
MNKKNNVIRQIDELGRIVLPIDMRNALNWSIGTPIELSFDEARGEVVLKRNTPSCICCGSIKELKSFHGNNICETCQHEIADL